MDKQLIVTMKKHLSYLAVAALIFCGCAKEETPESLYNVDNTITVLMPEIATKTAFGTEADGKLPLVWSEGDKIAIAQDLGQATEKRAVYVLDEGVGSAAGKFKYESGATDISKITDVVYPSSTVSNLVIPTNQTYTEGSFDPKTVVMAWNNHEGVGENGIQLSTEASVLCLMLKSSNGAEITRIKTTLTYAGEEPSEVVYTLNCPRTLLSETATPFYITVQGSENACNATFAISHSSIIETQSAEAKTFSAFEVSRFPVLDIVAQEVVVQMPIPGDIRDGGLVFEVGDDYYKIMSLDETIVHWATSGAADVEINEEDLESGIEKNKLFKKVSNLTEYLAAAWCIKHEEEGWYLPSRLELKAIRENLGLDNTETQTTINQTITGNEGTALSFDKYYWSCEEKADGKARCMKLGNGTAGTYSKTTTERPVRAVRKITIN